MPVAVLPRRSSSVVGLDPEQETPRPPATPATRERRRLPRIAARPTDAFLPLSLGLWLAGVRAVQPAAMDDYGLLSALPVVFFVGLGLLLCSISLLFVRTQLSPVRLGLHLVALVVVLHGTIPLIFTQPNFPWVYKHIGVVNYIHLHGSLDSSVDIYQNWPGFFALSAWFDHIAGVGGPLTYAAWAPVYFNLLTCLGLAFVFRSLPVTRRVRWLALFLFVAGNWVGQDYFAPQAMAFVLSLAVFGMVLAWFQVDRPPAPVRAIRRLASRIASRRLDRSQEPDGDQAPPPRSPPRIATMSALFVTFTVVVVIHPLSPYVVILGAGVVTIAGLVRPRWLVAGLVALAMGYLFLRLPYIRRTQDLFVSLGDPLHNIDSGEPALGVPMKGRKLTALAAPALIVGLWTLGVLGVLRRLRARRTALLIALLAGSPGLILLGQSYGGEAVFRIYLFSLPWVAVLGACALDPRPRRWPLWSAVKVGVVLSVTVALFMSAFFGAEELYQVRPGEVAASQYFYDHAEPDSVFFTVTPGMFPIRVSARYDEFRAMGDNPPTLLSTVPQFRHRVLGRDDLPAIWTFVDSYVPGGAPGRYLILSTGQDVYARVLGLLPPGSMASLDRALAESPNWTVYYRNADAVIYRLLRPSVDQPGGGSDAPATPPEAYLAPAEPSRTVESTTPAEAHPAAVEPSRTVTPAQWRDESRDWVATGTGLLGMILVVLVWRRRRAMAAAHIEMVLNKEETTMPGIATANGADAEPEALDATVPIADIQALLRQALLTPPSGRDVLSHALRNLQPDPARFRELAAAVDPAQRPEAVRLLGEAWGAASTAQIVIDELSGAVGVAAAEALDGSAEAVTKLRHLLSDDLSSEVRAAAVRALAGAPEGDQMWALSAALGDPEPQVRLCAIETLPVAGTARAARSVLVASEDGDERVRRAAYARLAAATPGILWMAIDRCSRLEELCAVLRWEAPPERLLALVVERTSSPEPRDRILGLELAAHLQTTGWVEESVNALQDRDASVRHAAATRLPGRPEAVPALIAALHDDPDPRVRTEAATALDSVEMDTALLAFIGALQDPDADVQRTAISALVRRSSPALARRVAEGLTRANTGSAGAVLLRMGSVGEDALVTAAVEGPTDRALAAVSLLRTTTSVKSLVELVGAVDPTTRLRAVEALGALGGPEALDGLVAALSDSRPGIRSRAALHLGQLGDGGGREPLRRVSERDQAPEVLRAARTALRLIDDRARQAGIGVDGE